MIIKPKYFHKPLKGVIGTILFVLFSCSNTETLEKYLQVLQETTPEDIHLFMLKNNIDSVQIYYEKGDLGLIKPGDITENHNRSGLEISYENHMNWDVPELTYIFDKNYTWIGVKGLSSHTTYTHKVKDETLLLITQGSRNNYARTDTNTYFFNNNQIIEGYIPRWGKEKYTYYPNGKILSKIVTLDERFKKQLLNPTVTYQYTWTEDQQIKLFKHNEGDASIHHIHFNKGVPYMGYNLEGNGDTSAVFNYRVYKNGEQIKSIKEYPY